MDPRLAPIQRLASEAIWNWFDELWEGEQVSKSRLADLQHEVLPLFERIETSATQDLDDAIVDHRIEIDAATLGRLNTRTSTSRSSSGRPAWARRCLKVDISWKSHRRGHGP